MAQKLSVYKYVLDFAGWQQTVPDTTDCLATWIVSTSLTVCKTISEIRGRRLVGRFVISEILCLLPVQNYRHFGGTSFKI